MSKRRRIITLGTPSVLLSHLGHHNSDYISSSSSDEDDGAVYRAVFQELFSVPPCVPKVQDYICTVVQHYSGEEFRKNFRLRRQACYDLIGRFEKSDFFPSDRHHGGSPAKTPEEHILSFLWYAANKASMRECSALFNMAESTQLVVINRVLDFLCQIAPNVIHFSSDKHALAEVFLNLAGFPNVIGCIDGTYIPIRCPSNKIRSTYINRHDQVSITMQGICDARGRFLDVFTGPPSKVHDARVLRLSPVHEDLPTVCEVNKFHILGDAAYPLREHLLTPYKNYGPMRAAQVAYNQRHAATRVIIENAFGMLKQRFRQLRYVEFTTVDKITKFVISCCVLHNICLDGGDFDVNDLLTDAERNECRTDAILHSRLSLAELRASRQPVSASESALRRLGELKRNALAERF